MKRIQQHNIKLKCQDKNSVLKIFWLRDLIFSSYGHWPPRSWVWKNGNIEIELGCQIIWRTKKYIMRWWLQCHHWCGQQFLKFVLHSLSNIFMGHITDHMIKQIKAGPIKSMTRTLLIWLNLTRGWSLMMYRPHCPGQHSAININLHLQFIQIRMTKPEY